MKGKYLYVQSLIVYKYELQRRIVILYAYSEVLWLSKSKQCMFLNIIKTDLKCFLVNQNAQKEELLSVPL